MSLQDRVNKEVQMWMIYAAAGQTEKAKEHYDKYIKLVTEMTKNG